MTSEINDETWARIAPRVSARRRPAVIVLIPIAMTVLAILAWGAGAVVPRLSATPTLVEPGAARGSVRLHVELRNEGLVQAQPSSVSPGTTLPVRSLKPHFPGSPDGLPAEPRMLPVTGWALSGGARRTLVLELDVRCGSEPAGWRLEMVAYGPLSGYEVNIPWEDGRLPGWRRAVADAACG
ncbi:hypothetical protein [Planobispora rosea]|uniref:hypothetical protein n=1 Tax=Planobispora rosea TaxID=35762 RepID=UPI00114C9769|nr:hypothetical protein [Planobispora rosea]